MQLTFLGTGPAEAIPRRGHRDRLCVAARRGGKSRRSRSAALLRDRNTTLLLDAGPDIVQQLLRAMPRRLTAVLLTHAHSDAVGGLRDLCRWVTRYLKGVRVPLCAHPLTLRHVRRLYGTLRPLSFHPLLPYRRRRFGAVSVMPVAVDHSLTPGTPTFGYVFGKRLAYASDVAALPQRSQKILRGLPLFVLDAAMYFGSPMAAHLTPSDALRIARELRVRKLVLTQLGHAYPPHEIAERSIRRYLRGLQAHTPKTVRLAYDGLTIRA